MLESNLGNDSSKAFEDNQFGDDDYPSDDDDADELIDYDEEMVISRLKGLFRPHGNTSNKQVATATERYQPTEKRLAGRYGAQVSNAETCARRAEQSLSRADDELAADSRGNYTGKLTNASRSVLMAVQRADERDRERTRDKSDRATCEQALDARTRIILFKLLARGVLTQIDGCVSTGKEANVYYARGHIASHSTASFGTVGGSEQAASQEQERELAVKVFKTSVLHFRDRDRYVTGEFRWRRGYARANPRKLVRLWTEKEMRNLARMRQAGMRCPEALLLRGNVLVMQFIGEAGNAAPLLQAVEFGAREPLERAYLDIMRSVRTMYQRCRLVHADLSAFNMLYFKEEVWLIDVSQAVEHDHPNALEFLRNDLKNVSDFFRKRGLRTPTLRAVFDYVTSIVLAEQDEQSALERLYAAAQLDDADVEELESDSKLDGKRKMKADKTDKQPDDDELLRHVYIPRTLNDARVNFERDFYNTARGEDDRPVFYKQLLGLKSDLSGAARHFETVQPNLNSNSDESDSHSESGASENEDEAQSASNESDTDDEQTTKKQQTSSARDRNESPNSRKLRKLAIKVEQREKRKEKMPKSTKKRKVKMAKQKR